RLSSGYPATAWCGTALPQPRLALIKMAESFMVFLRAGWVMDGTALPYPASPSSRWRSWWWSALVYSALHSCKVVGLRDSMMIMNGASALVGTLADCGVELCLANPGTSEMHLVQALDGVPRVKSVLTLFEGVATGAADGYGRMMGKPAVTLLHLGPGLANGIANLHNARRANTPLLNIIGNHPDYHLGFDAPLTSDIEALTGNFSCWTKASSTAQSLAQDGADACTATLQQSGGSTGQIANLIVGADAAWGESGGVVVPNALPRRAVVDESAVVAVADVLGGDGVATVLLLEHHAVTDAALEAAGCIAAATGCRLMTGTFPGRIDGGPGRVKVERLPYFPEQVLQTLQGVRRLILVGGQVPVSFFAYQGVPGELVPEDCGVSRLSLVEEDAVDALVRVAERLGAGKDGVGRFEKEEVARPVGELNNQRAIQGIAATMPEDVIVCTDSGAGNVAYQFCQGRVRNSWLSLTGGAIGQGGPCATGAALACPERAVLMLGGDGGAAYTNQSFWTQAREGLNVTSVIFANHSYNILDVEYKRLGVERVGDIAASLFDIGNPEMDWVKMAESFGVPGVYVDSGEQLCKHLERGFTTPGPLLIQASGQLQRSL
ncbi:MAG: acetolactate synthase large subunit, partial [Pseudohongiellaceae bacterium]